MFSVSPNTGLVSLLYGPSYSENSNCPACSAGVSKSDCVSSLTRSMSCMWVFLEKRCESFETGSLSRSSLQAHSWNGSEHELHMQAACAPGGCRGARLTLFIGAT